MRLTEVLSPSVPCWAISPTITKSTCSDGKPAGRQQDVLHPKLGSITLRSLDCFGQWRSWHTPGQRGLTYSEFFVFPSSQTAGLFPLSCFVYRTGVYSACMLGSCKSYQWDIAKISNYIADAYEIYSSSAQAAQSFVRNMGAAIVPQFGRQIVSR
jgi:hypothetical protein